MCYLNKHDSRHGWLQVHTKIHCISPITSFQQGSHAMRELEFVQACRNKTVQTN